MPRPRKPPRLYLRERAGREPQWVILDGSREYSTGCGAADVAGATEALKAHLEKSHRPSGGRSPDQVKIADILNFYMQEHVSTIARPDIALLCIDKLLAWWGDKVAADIKPKACRDYVKWRISAGERKLSENTARRDLSVLSAALNFYHGEFTLTALPVVKMPRPPRSRQDWLTRSQAAALLWAAWRNPDAQHLARVILIGLYSGTRSGAILRLRWLPSTDTGWIDLDHERLYRRGDSQRVTKKRQPPAPIHARLLPHLRRWARKDAATEPSAANVIHYRGAPVIKLRRSWRTACKEAGLPNSIVPHTLRHTAATWQMQAGTDIWQAAGYLGMSVETLERHYGHHHPDYQGAAARAEPPRKCPGNSRENRERKRIRQKACP